MTQNCIILLDCLHTQMCLIPSHCSMPYKLTPTLTYTPGESGVLKESHKARFLPCCFQYLSNVYLTRILSYFCITVIESKKLFDSLKTSDKGTLPFLLQHLYIYRTFNPISFPERLCFMCTYASRGLLPLNSGFMAEAVCWVSISSIASLIKSRKICCSDSARTGPWEDGWLKVSTCRRETTHSYILKTTVISCWVRFY